MTDLLEPTDPAPRSRLTARALGGRSAARNLLAQGCATLIVAVAGVLIARTSGAAVLGEYALLRVMPWLTGVVLSCGLPMASAYFLAAAHRTDPRLRATLTVLALLGAALGSGLWLLATPLLHRLFFAAMPLWLLAAVAATVSTQLITVWGKACCQGAADIRGANLVIVVEEMWPLLCYLTALGVGLRGITAVVAGLLGGGVCATATALLRLAHQGFFRRWGRPSTALAKQVTHFGARAQLGNLLLLTNLRLDFLILGALAGPAVLGVYAVASKFAELMRLPATALNYVLYPRFAREGAHVAGRDVRRLLPRAAALISTLTPLLAVAAVIALPLLYGQAFRGAVLPACVLLVGLVVEGASAVASAFLCGIGRPGANSIGMGAGVVVTVALDLALIPGHGALGAAVASSLAYLISTALLTVLTYRLAARRPVTAHLVESGEPA